MDLEKKMKTHSLECSEKVSSVRLKTILLGIKNQQFFQSERLAHGRSTLGKLLLGWNENAGI
jgi:hypothetical protein